MNETNAALQVMLRIPGQWSNPGELIERLPPGYQLTPDELRLPSGALFEFIPMPPDEQFPRIFASSCREMPLPEEQATVESYSVNIGLKGPGGSLESAHAIMQAGAAIIQAGGAGVFIDNCALAHGGSNWLEMTEDGSPDAISFAFAAIIRGEQEVYTMGMHIMGFPDLLMRRADLNENGDAIIDILRYVCSSDAPVDVDHLIVDETGPRFQVVAKVDAPFEPGSPMHNPHGRLKFVSMKDIASSN